MKTKQMILGWRSCSVGKCLWKHRGKPVHKGVAFIDAWDKDGNGMIYYINDRSVDDSEDGAEAEAIDDAAYQEWWKSLMDDAKELEIPFVNLTTENIEKI